MGQNRATQDQHGLTIKTTANLEQHLDSSTHPWGSGASWAVLQPSATRINFWSTSSATWSHWWFPPFSGPEIPGHLDSDSRNHFTPAKNAWSIPLQWLPAPWVFYISVVEIQFRPSLECNGLLAMSSLRVFFAGITMIPNHPRWYNQHLSTTKWYNSLCTINSEQKNTDRSLWQSTSWRFPSWLECFHHIWPVTRLWAPVWSSTFTGLKMVAPFSIWATGADVSAADWSSGYDPMTYTCLENTRCVGVCVCVRVWCLLCDFPSHGKGAQIYVCILYINGYYRDIHMCIYSYIYKLEYHT